MDVHQAVTVRHVRLSHDRVGIFELAQQFTAFPVWFSCMAIIKMPLQVQSRKLVQAFTWYLPHSLLFPNNSLHSL